MMLAPNTASFAALTVERLLYTLTAGTALAAIVSAALRVLPARNSQTRFAVWFSALIAIAALPFATLVPMPRLTNTLGSSPRALFTISTSWAEYIVLGWAVLAVLGLVRVVVGLWRLRHLRRSSVALSPLILDQETRSLIARLSGRSISLLVSSRVEVPTAIGFVRPAIILPAWLVAAREQPDSDSANEDLKFVLLHELAHLRRWDDWTNLAQQVLKSIFFFHPGILWIERKLALDREMACDDAVLAQTGTPRSYAECLTHVAEKSLIRRQIALAQAAVSKMKQLSNRVAWIMNPRRSQNTRVWKPAIPLVAGAALFCAISASSTGGLIGFSDGLHLASDAEDHIQLGVNPAAAAQGVSRNSATLAAKVTGASLRAPAAVQAVPADLKFGSRQHPAKWQHRDSGTSAATGNLARRAAVPPTFDGRDKEKTAELVMSSYGPLGVVHQSPAETTSDVVLVIVTSRNVNSSQGSYWQVSAWELYFYVPASSKQIPRKT